MMSQFLFFLKDKVVAQSKSAPIDLKTATTWDWAVVSPAVGVVVDDIIGITLSNLLV